MALILLLKILRTLVRLSVRRIIKAVERPQCVEKSPIEESIGEGVKMKKREVIIDYFNYRDNRNDFYKIIAESMINIGEGVKMREVIIDYLNYRDNRKNNFYTRTQEIRIKAVDIIRVIKVGTYLMNTCFNPKISSLS
jgi:hypothetical protein